MRKYLDEVRPRFAGAEDEGALFLSEDGNSLVVDHLSQIVTRYVRTSGIEKRGSCHLFRHTMATLMLENGADIRFVQEMLGHASLATTQIYTHVSIRKLQEIHRATHPAAKMERSAAAGEELDDEGERKVE